MRPLKLLIISLCFFGFLSGASYASNMTPVQEAASILEKSTAFHWGRDCLVWVVHYPEELVTPWTDADSSTQNYDASQKEEYRRAFKKQLRMDSSEPFLVTIYNFGSSPLEIAPLSEHLFLINSSNERFTSLSYEEKLDSPISGIVQGLVFFPKQTGPFYLSFKGLGVYDDQIFLFPVFETRKTVSEEISKEVKDHVVELPPVKPEKKVLKEKEEPTPEKVELEEPSIEEPPAWLGPGPDLTPKKKILPVERAISSDLPVSKDFELDSSKEKQDETEEDRNKALEEFLSLWSKGDFSKMYGLLSDENRSKETLESFSDRASKSPLRWYLAKGYSLNWLGPKKVKISVAQKLVLIRVLQSEVLSMSMENGRWRFAW